MKKLYLHLVIGGFLLSFGFSLKGQVNLPYTLHFTTNDAVNWTDGIAQDGDGGTSDINGLTLQIYTAGTDHLSLYTFADSKPSTIEWYDNSYYYSNSSSYTGITSGPSVDATNNGVPAMVIKSADNTVNFSLLSIQLYDWGYTNVITIETYDNGLKVGSVDFTPDPSFNPLTISQSDLLTPTVFSNIDEIRFFPKSDPVFNLSFNNISLAAAGTLPVTFSSIKAIKQNKSIDVQWKVSNQTGIEKFEVERSADGKTFSGLGTEEVKGTSGASAFYDRVDNNPLPGNNFYRIKSIDKSGLAEFSSVAIVNFEALSPSLLVYPNPVTGNRVHLQMSQVPPGVYRLQLLNSGGKVLIDKCLTLQPGVNDENLSFSHLPKGIYLIRVTQPDHSTLEKTIVY